MHMESYSNIKSSSILNPSEDNNVLFITGYNSLLTNDDTMATRDFCLLLLVYVNYFCIALLSIVLKGLCEFGKGVQSKFSERVDFVCISIVFYPPQKKQLRYKQNQLFH